MTRVNRWNDPTAPGDSLWSEADEQRRKKRRLKVFGASGIVALLLLVAVWNSGGGTAKRSAGMEPVEAGSFLDKAGDYLSRADDFIVVDLSSEVIVMRKMPDDELLIAAIVLDDPDQEGDQFTIFQVPEPFGNPQFLSRGDPPGSRGVRQGDTIYFFAKEDEDSQKEYKVYRDVQRPKAFKLQVKDVVDERTLRTFGGMTGEVSAPQFMEIWRHVFKSEIEEQRESWLDQDTAGVNWEPSPDRPVLVRATADLNQWMRELKADEKDIEWKADPLLMPARTGANKELFVKSIEKARLDELSFDLHDARFIQEAVWLRDVSRTARSEISDLDKAKKLFDWTVRHIQLEPQRADGNAPRSGLWHRPWQTLLYGRGTATERAWVFILLARQQGLNVVMLAHPNPTDPKNPKFWLPALLSDERQLYLFDPALGIPIPGLQGREVATLADVLADGGLLRRLDLDDNDLQNGALRYGTSAADLKPRPDLKSGLVAFIEASPRYFSKRMKLLQSKWSGDHRLVLTHNASALRQQLMQVDGIEAVRLWPQAAFVYHQQETMPPKLREVNWDNFRVFIWVPSLWKARTMSFREIDEPAPRRASAARSATSSPVGVVDQAARDAIYYYLRCHKPDVDVSIENIPTARSWLIKKREFDQYAKMQAGYWLGLVHFDRGQHAYAADFFKNRALEAYPDGPWQHGAAYNLARALEELDEPEKAIKLYRDDVDSPQRHGNLLRARRLEASLPPPAKVDSLPPNPDPQG